MLVAAVSAAAPSSHLPCNWGLGLPKASNLNDRSAKKVLYMPDVFSSPVPRCFHCCTSHWNLIKPVGTTPGQSHHYVSLPQIQPRNSQGTQPPWRGSAASGHFSCSRDEHGRRSMESHADSPHLLPSAIPLHKLRCCMRCPQQPPLLPAPLPRQSSDPVACAAATMWHSHWARPLSCYEGASHKAPAGPPVMCPGWEGCRTLCSGCI